MSANLVHGSGPRNAKIAIVGEAPGTQDLLRGEPFCGLQGLELGKMLTEAGISLASCYMTLAYKSKLPLNKAEAVIAFKKKDESPSYVSFNGKLVDPSVVEYAEMLKAELSAMPSLNAVCAVGNLALFALTGEWGVHSWRSSLMESTLIPGLKVIPTLSPSILHTQWSKRVIIVHDLKRVLRESATKEIKWPIFNAIIRPDFDLTISTLNKLISMAEASPEPMKLAADIETRRGHISCIGFAWSSTEAITIPFMEVVKPTGYWTPDEEAQIVALIYRLMRQCKIIGQNWLYDAQYIYRHWHFTCPNVEDTMIQQHSCFSNMEKGLAFLSSMYLDDHVYWKDDITGWEDGGQEDQYWLYNAKDCIRTFNIHTVLSNVVKSLGMEEVNKFQQSLCHAVLKTMNIGLRINATARLDLSMSIQAQGHEREAWLTEAIGHPVNIKSPKQMAELFYEELGQREVRKKRPDGTLSTTTNDEALRTIAEREPLLLPITRRISELRSLGVFHSTFVQAPVDLDGRIRTSFNVGGTETYRFSSSKNAFGTGLNCQNIPKGGGTEGGELELPNIRKLFIPDPGYTFFDIDLDSADLRIVTWESDCAWMKDHFKNNRKPYIEVMREYYRDNTMTKKSHPREYGLFKSLCHGTNYLGTAEGIAPRIGLNVHETSRIQDWYFGMCPEIRAWQERIKKQVISRRYVENAYGYRMFFFDKIEGTIFNQAVAWIPQSSVACLINRGYMNLHRNHPEIQVLLQVHDSLAGQYPSWMGDDALRKIRAAAENPIPYDDPLVIPVGVVSSAASWGDCD